MYNLPIPDEENYDLDSWAISIETHQLSTILGTMGLVTLAHHSLEIQDHADFADYVFVAQGGCTIRIPPKFKEGVLKKLWKNYHIIAHPSKHPLVLNMGSPSCTVGMLQEILHQLCVPNLRLASYGMKCPFSLVFYNLGDGVRDFMKTEQKKNHFDIGFIHYPYYGTRHFRHEILLAKRPPGARKCQSESYPTLLELGEGFGTINLKPDHEAITRLKCYSSLTHALKATSQKDMKYAPTIATTWNTRLNTLEKKVDILAANDPVHLCGLRFEATVYASTVDEAQEIVRRSGYLHPLPYSHGPDHPNEQIALNFKAIPVLEYFSYVALMLKKLKQMKTEVSQKHETQRKITDIQKQAMVDVANAIGWNGGRGQRPTSVDREKVPEPWWDNCQWCNHSSYPIDFFFFELMFFVCLFVLQDGDSWEERRKKKEMLIQRNC
jgi:hypothetical protein